jgi:hypothetical protein
MACGEKGLIGRRAAVIELPGFESRAVNKKNCGFPYIGEEQRGNGVGGKGLMGNGLGKSLTI